MQFPLRKHIFASDNLTLMMLESASFTMSSLGIDYKYPMGPSEP